MFADIEPDTLCLDLRLAESLITARTRAVMFVSLNGRSPADLAGFIARCRARGVKVIEDAAQSLGSFRDGRHLGTLGDCGCLSFSSQKLVTTGQGGAVLTDDEEIYRRMGLLRDFGRLEGGSDHYLSVGWNLKFTDLQAVVGLQQMRRLPELVTRKREIFARYQEQLAGIPGLEIPSTDLASVSPWFVDVLVDRRCEAPADGASACPRRRQPARLSTAACRARLRHGGLCIRSPRTSPPAGCGCRHRCASPMTKWRGCAV